MGGAFKAELPAWFIDSVRLRGAVVLAGAGVSSAPPSSLPGWYALNRMIVTALGERVESYLGRPNYTREVQASIDARRTDDAFPPDFQAQILNEHAGEDYFRALVALDVDETNDGHQAIARMAADGAVKAIVTTNFDRLIEHALSARGVAFEVAYERDTYAKCLARLSEKAEGPLQVIKIHGCVQNHLSLIDTLKQRLLGRNADLLSCLSRLLADHPWAFVGFSAADLETDENYLGLVPAAATSPGIVYVSWPGSPELSAGAAKLIAAYGDKAAHVVSDTAPFFGALAEVLGLSHGSTVEAPGANNSRQQVESELRSWASSLHPASAVTCLATVAEAAGRAEDAFRLLHRLWKDVLPTDRQGSDFDRYRFQHGRLGIGGSLLSAVEDLSKDVGMESLQNLLRVAPGEPRASAWAGVGLVWGGRVATARPLLSDAQRVFDNDAEPERGCDAWFALAQALFLMVEPEGVLENWPAPIRAARQAGDLPREASVAALASLFHAEFATGRYTEFSRAVAEPILSRARRLHDPTVTGFAALARGRYLTKQRIAREALDSLRVAQESLGSAGRPGWQLVATIEYVKALLDVGTEESADLAYELSEQINDVVDRYQILLPWHEEARGQIHLCTGRREEAQASFERGITYATQLGLLRKADAMRAYLAYCAAPVGPDDPLA